MPTEAPTAAPTATPTAAPTTECQVISDLQSCLLQCGHSENSAAAECSACCESQWCPALTGTACQTEIEAWQESDVYYPFPECCDASAPSKATICFNNCGPWADSAEPVLTLQPCHQKCLVNVEVCPSIEQCSSDFVDYMVATTYPAGCGLTPSECSSAQFVTTTSTTTTTPTIVSFTLYADCESADLEAVKESTIATLISVNAIDSSGDVLAMEATCGSINLAMTLRTKALAEAVTQAMQAGDVEIPVAGVQVPAVAFVDTTTTTTATTRAHGNLGESISREDAEAAESVVTCPSRAAFTAMSVFLALFGIASVVLAFLLWLSCKKQKSAAVRPAEVNRLAAVSSDSLPALRQQ